MASRWSTKPGRKSRVPALATTPANHRQLTAAEVRYERVALAADMLGLLLADDERLPPRTHATLQTMHCELVRLWDKLRRQTGTPDPGADPGTAQNALRMPQDR